MDPRTFPTKGNLILAKNSLALANQGYELMDKKRNILIRELMDLIDQAKEIQEKIDSTFTYAYKCLQRANIEHGINLVSQIAYTVPIEKSIRIKSRSIMGTEIPLVTYTPEMEAPTYSFSTTKESIDVAREAFKQVKDLTIKLSMVENAAYRLAGNIKKTQKRANDSTCVFYFQCAGGKGEGRIYPSESDQADERIGSFPKIILGSPISFLNI